VAGRQAPLAAGLAVGFGGGLALIPVHRGRPGRPWANPLAGSVALGAAVGLSGCVFAAVGAVCAQLTVSARTARGMAVGVLGWLSCSARWATRRPGHRGCAGPHRWGGPSKMRVYANPAGA